MGDTDSFHTTAVDEQFTDRKDHAPMLAFMVFIVVKS